MAHWPLASCLISSCFSAQAAPASLAVVSADAPASVADDVTVGGVGCDVFSAGAVDLEVALMLLGSSFLQPGTDIANANAHAQWRSLELSFMYAPMIRVIAQVTRNDLHPRILRCDCPGDNEFVTRICGRDTPENSIGIGERSPTLPCHTTVDAGPRTAVQWVTRGHRGVEEGRERESKRRGTRTAARGYAPVATGREDCPPFVQAAEHARRTIKTPRANAARGVLRGTALGLRVSLRAPRTSGRRDGVD